MKSNFTLAHVGINTKTPEEAAALASLLSGMFNLTPRKGGKSMFAGNLFECMNTPYLGRNGHIALETDDLAVALKELAEKNIFPNMETASYLPDGRLKNVYLQGEYGGFAIHILQKSEPSEVSTKTEG